MVPTFDNMNKWWTNPLAVNISPLFLNSKKWILFFLCTLHWIQLSAQTSESALGRFQVNYATGCTPFQVTITERLGLGQTFYVYVDSLVSEKTFSFNEPGEYTIFQFIQDDDDPQGKIDSIKIQLNAPQDPDFTIFTCPGNQVAVEILDSYYDYYQVLFSPSDTLVVGPGETSAFVFVDPNLPSAITVKGFFAGGSPSCPSVTKTYVPLQPLAVGEITAINATSDSLVQIAYDIGTNANYFLEKREGGGNFSQVLELNPSASSTNVEVAADVSTCFRITTIDACSGAHVAGDTVCSVILRGLSTTNGNRMLWTGTSTDSLASTLIKNDSAIFAGVAAEFFDTDLLCQKEDCYQITRGRATSNTVCITANRIFNLGPPQNLQSTIAEGEIVLTWEIPGQPPVREYQLFFDDGSRFFTSPDFEVRLTPNFETAPFLYSIDYRDECNNVSSASNGTSPIFLNAEFISGNEHTLAWTSYIGWEEEEPVYFVEQRSGEDGNWNRQEVASGIFSFPLEIEEVSNFFRVVAVSAIDPNRTSVSNEVFIEKNVLVEIPTAFTPNDDGTNDTFRVIAEDITNFSIFIFNRWGEMVFQSEDINQGWNGTYLGKKMRDGTFTYRVSYETEGGKQQVRTGSFVLIRHWR